jgi:tight adherence protein B
VLLPLLVFVVITAVTGGGFAVFMHLRADKTERRIGERLREVGQPAIGSEESESATVVRKAIESPLPMIDKLLHGSGPGAWLAALIEQSGVSTTPAAVMVLSVICGATLGIAASMIVRFALLAVALVFIGATLPVLYLMQRRGSRRRRFEEQFPEALDLLSRALRAGHAFQSALGMVADELPDPVGTEFKKTFEQQNFGLPLTDALNELAARTRLLDVRFFVTAVTIQRETGGNLSEILDNLAEVVRERFKLLRQVRVHTAHGRFTGYVLLSLPAALGIALSFISADHMNTLFNHPLGRTMMVGAGVMQTIGYFWIRQVIKIEV